MTTPPTISGWRERWAAEKLPMAPVPAAPQPARLLEDGRGGALVIIGSIASPYANARMAQLELEAMEHRGLVMIQGRPAPC